MYMVMTFTLDLNQVLSSDKTSDPELCAKSEFLKKSSAHHSPGYFTFSHLSWFFR